MPNSYEQQAIDLVNERGSLMIENSELKAQVNLLLKACQLYGDSIFSGDKTDEADTIVIMTPGQCLNSVEVSAIRDLARRCCPASGYIIQSEESRKQMLDWANFEEACNNEGTDKT